MKLLTVKELSDLLSVKKSTLYLWVENGQIPHYRVGRLVRFNTEEIDEWLKIFKKEVKTQEKKGHKHLKNISIYKIDDIIRKAIDDAKSGEV